MPCPVHNRIPGQIPLGPHRVAKVSVLRPIKRNQATEIVVPLDPCGFVIESAFPDSERRTVLFVMKRPVSSANERHRPDPTGPTSRD